MKLPQFKTIILAFLVGAVIFSFWPKFISPKVETYRREKNLIELQKDYEFLDSVVFPEEFLDWQTVVDGGIASFSAQAQEKVDLVDERISFWQKKVVLEDVKKLFDLNFSALLSAKDLLAVLGKRFSYLYKIEATVKFINEDVEGFGPGDYKKIVESPEVIKERMRKTEEISRSFKEIGEVPEDLEEFHKQIEKTLRAQLDFWANNEIAVERHTPTIYSQSFWVLKGDWDLLSQIGRRDLDIEQSERFKRLKSEFEKEFEKLTPEREFQESL